MLLTPSSSLETSFKTLIGCLDVHRFQPISRQKSSLGSLRSLRLEYRLSADHLHVVIIDGRSKDLVIILTKLVGDMYEDKDYIYMQLC